MPADPFYTDMDRAAWRVQLDTAHAEVARLLAERTALLAPVEGVDVEDVLELDRERVALTIVAVGDPATTNRRLDCTERLATAAPNLAREVARLRAALAAAEGERDAARAEVEELRLTLAAEQGKAEGAPSKRWTCDGRSWYGSRNDGGIDKIEMYTNLNGDGTVCHARVWLDIDRFGYEAERGRFDLARAAMLAADAAGGER